MCIHLVVLPVSLLTHPRSLAKKLREKQPTSSLLQRYENCCNAGRSKNQPFLHASNKASHRGCSLEVCRTGLHMGPNGHVRVLLIANLAIKMCVVCRHPFIDIALLDPVLDRV